MITVMHNRHELLKKLYSMTTGWVGIVEWQHLFKEPILAGATRKATKRKRARIEIQPCVKSNIL